MPKSRSRASKATLIAVLAGLSALPVHAQDASLAPVQSLPGQAGVRDLYLEVFINDVSTGLIGSFSQAAQGGLKANPEELRDVGLRPLTSALGADGLVTLDNLPGVAFRIDEESQRLYVTAVDEARAARMVDVAPQAAPAGQKPQASYGAVLNYSLFASTNDLAQRSSDIFSGISGGFDARVFSPYGTLSQGFVAGLDDGELGGFRRLNTSWSYSDPERLLTYRGGDFVSGGLSWTRPVYLGGFQLQRNFSLRSDLVTLPMPSFTGTAAVPSTLEVYTQNVRTYSGDIPAGPFEVTNLPVFTGAGEAQVVLRDNLGRETTARLPFYNSSTLLRQGLFDFSAEVGFPRRNFGAATDDYNPNLYGSASGRYGLTNWLTLEGHMEGGEDLANGGAGMAFPLGPFGAASVAAAGSYSAGRSGGLINATVELSHSGFALYGRIQRALGDYQDIASVTANAAIPAPQDVQIFSPGVPRAFDQITLSAPALLDFSTLNLSYSRIKSADGETNRIASISYSQPAFGDASIYATAFADLDGSKSFGIFAGLSMSFGNNISASTSVENDGDGTRAVADFAKSERTQNGSVGWRVRFSEGATPSRSAAASYRTLWARIEVGAQQYGRQFRGTAQADGAIAAVDGDVFIANRIDDAFAAVDVGVPGVEVMNQNRPVGTSNRHGKILVTDLNSYQPNTISIDPKNLPVDADIAATQEVVVPTDRSGVVVDFGVSRAPAAALVSLVDTAGNPLGVGSTGRIEGSGAEFVIGYDGEAYIRGLTGQNTATIELPDGRSCRATFAYHAAAGTQVVVRNVVCS